MVRLDDSVRITSPGCDGLNIGMLSSSSAWACSRTSGREPDAHQRTQYLAERDGLWGCRVCDSIQEKEPRSARRLCPCLFVNCRVRREVYPGDRPKFVVALPFRLEVALFSLADSIPNVGHVGSALKFNRDQLPFLGVQLLCDANVRIPRDGDQRSELMSITIPK